MEIIKSFFTSLNSENYFTALIAIIILVFLKQKQFMIFLKLLNTKKLISFFIKV